ncbi:hypothetical protein [Streptomyces sp. SID5785]|uniref:hypothetical protein n=1 Tax=Streptomyces sp. SID5785 TaxID=2690309 RepID=UPI001F16ED15|nr:hypothetical protein [Streptomyces sp. SID5785]
MAEQGYQAVRTHSGPAVHDTSLAQNGITAEYAANRVSLSWEPYRPDARYVVTRDDRQIAVTEPGQRLFEDTHVHEATEYQYKVIPILDGDTAGAQTWGLRAVTPSSTRLQEVDRLARQQATTAAAAKMTTVTWQTFIPQKKIDAPPAGCSYTRGYQFGGDGRGFDWKSSKYRTALNALINWNRKSVTGSGSIGTTHVYRKSTGKLVAKKKASASQMKAKKLGASGSSVDIRMVTHASNPFCKGLGGVKGAIDGALTMTVTQGGNWTIRSGDHRLMPNHHIYIYNNGKVTNVYKRKYANLSCLIGKATCDLANLTGRRGSYR